MILVRHPANCPIHREWVVTQLFERLGVPITFESGGVDWRISVLGQPGSVSLTDVFFENLQADEILEAPAPKNPVPWCSFALNDTVYRLPVLFGNIEDYWHLVITPGQDVRFEVDVFGSAFWLMTRIEELDGVGNDSHDRFSAFQSHAWRNGYLMQPVVDEYMQLLRKIFQQIWPNLILEKKAPLKIFLSHDVDDPYAYHFMPIGKAARLITANTVKAKTPLVGARWMLGLGLSRLGIHSTDDPCDTFAWLMDQSERVGVASAFYFMATDRSCALDANYDICDTRITDLLSRVIARGHEVGMHPGYQTYRDPQLLATQYELLVNGLRRAGIEGALIGSRMHYLRWNPSLTPAGLWAAGVAYDSTLGYADHPGFRCGTCFPFYYFDPINGVATRLTIRPLVVMDCTVLAKRYMNLGATSEAFDVFKKLKDSCRRVGGEFSMLWHNSYLFSQQERDLYSAVIDC